MRTVVLGERPAELQALIDRRRALGLDRYDELWRGEYHMAPFAHRSHGVVKSRLLFALEPRARLAGLVAGDSFNLGEPEDFRVPDAGYHRAVPGTVYVATAAMVIEVLSPDDETFEKFDFYAAHGVDELLVADPAVRSVRAWQRCGSAYEPRSASRLLGVDTETLEREIDWP